MGTEGVRDRIGAFRHSQRTVGKQAGGEVPKESEGGVWKEEEWIGCSNSRGERAPTGKLSS